MADELDDLKRKVDLALENIGLKRENEQLLNDLTDVSISLLQGADTRSKQIDISDILRTTLQEYKGSDYRGIVKLLQSASARTSEECYQNLVLALGEEDAQSFVSGHGIEELERVVNILLEKSFPSYQLAIKALNPYSDKIREAILETIELASKPESKNHVSLESMLKTLSNASKFMREFIEKGTFRWSPENLIEVAYEYNYVLEWLYSIKNKYEGEAEKLIMGSLRKEYSKDIVIFIKIVDVLDEYYIAHIARFYDTKIIKKLIDLSRNNSSKENVLRWAQRAQHSSPVRGETAEVYLEMLEDTLSYGDKETAEWELATAKELDPSIVGGMPFYQAKYCDFNHGEFENAFLNLTEEITSNPHSEAYLMRGIARRHLLEEEYSQNDVDKEDHPELGDLSDSIKDFDKAIELNPKNAEAYVYRGEAHLDKGHVYPVETSSFFEAVDDFSEAIKLGYKIDHRAHFMRGQAYMEITMDMSPDFSYLGSAIADFTTVIERDPKHAPAHYWRGRANELKGDKDQATINYEMAKKLGYKK